MKTKTFSVRLEPALRDRLQKASDKTGVEEATIVRECLRAILDHVDEVGCLTFPISVNTAPAEPTQMVAEKQKQLK